MKEELQKRDKDQFMNNEEETFETPDQKIKYLE